MFVCILLIVYVHSFFYIFAVSHITNYVVLAIFFKEQKQFVFSPRDCNEATHLLAKYALVIPDFHV